MNIIFFFAIVAMLFLGGSNVQVSFGIDKLPFSIFTILMTLCYVIGNKGKFNSHKAEYGAIVILLVYFIVGQYGFNRDIGIRAIYSSYMLPPLVVVFLVENRNKLRQSVKGYINVVKIFFVIECFLAIVERVTLQRFFPDLGFDTGFEEFAEGFRSYSLFGHPLSNSGIVILLMNLFLISNFIKDRNKILLWSLGFVALLCFNSRLAIFLSVICFLIYIYTTFLRRGTGIFKKLAMVGTIFIAGFFIFQLIKSGWGDRIFLNSDNDSGSANARFMIFDIFQYMSFSARDILFGVSSNSIMNAQISMGASNMIIENPWILFMFRFGLAFLAPLILCYVFIFAKVFRGLGNYRTLFVLIFWLIVISSSNSIAAGGEGISWFLVLVFIFNIRNNIVTTYHN